MINKDIYLAPECLGGIFQLVEVIPNMYANGQRLTSPDGYKYVVCVRAHRNDQLSVAIPGAQLMETPPTLVDVYVDFNDLVVRPYVDRAGHLAYRATATGIRKVKRQDDALGEQKATKS